MYWWNFIHTISQVAHRKLAHHCLNPYQHAAFRCGIVCHNMGEEEADPTLELAMEYAGALGTIIFDESCRLHDLTEAQVGRNQFTMDVAVDRLDGEVDHVAECQGVPPSNSKGGLPAPEARVRTQKREQWRYRASSVTHQRRLVRQSRVKRRARPGDLTEKEARVRVTPKSLTRLRKYRRVSI